MVKVFGFFALILFLGCSSSKEKSEIVYSFSNLDFDFPSQEESIDLDSHDVYNLHKLNKFYLKEEHPDGKSSIRMTFVNENKFHDLDTPAYCATKDEPPTQIEQSYHLPYVVRVSAGSFVFSAPFEAKISKVEKDCSISFIKQSEFKNENFLYSLIASEKKAFSESPRALNSYTTIEWRTVYRDGKMFVYTRSQDSGVIRTTKSVYNNEVVIDLLSYDGNWRRVDFDGDKLAEDSSSYSDDSSSSSDTNSDDSQNDQDSGSVNIAIPEEWFE